MSEGYQVAIGYGPEGAQFWGVVGNGEIVGDFDIDGQQDLVVILRELANDIEKRHRSKPAANDEPQTPNAA